MSIAEELWKGYVQLYDQRRKYGSLPKSVRTSESFFFGTSPTWKWDIQQFFLRFPFGKGIDSGFQRNMFGDLQGPNTAVAFGCLARLNSWHFFFGGVYPHFPALRILYSGNFFVGGIRNRFVWLFPHLVGQPIVTWMFGAQWFLHVGQNEVHQRLDGDHLYTYLVA